MLLEKECRAGIVEDGSKSPPESASFYCKGQESKYFKVCGPKVSVATT